MRTSNRFAILAAIAAAPLLAIAAPSSTATKDVSRESQEKAVCQQACNCQTKASAKAETRLGGVDFFSATEHNPVP